MLKLHFFKIAVCFLSIFHQIGCVVRLDTNLGVVKGTTMLSRAGHKFNAFLGVPFAKPPVGDLRFENPVVWTEPWDTEFDATKYPPKCVQIAGIRVEGIEDCLYLNIYTPFNVSSNSSLPVWVFIYGGKRLFGDVLPYKYGPHYIMDKPVIFVAISFRTGPFGYMSTEDDAIPGNFGLKDQVAALQWIKSNILAFGGDPNCVTLSGASSGGIDVSLHLLSPLSKGLFHRAISQSAHPLNARLIMNPGENRKITWNMAKLVGCNTENIKTSEQLSACLKTVPASSIILNVFTMSRHFILPFILFGPVMERNSSKDAFLVNSPLQELSKPNPVPWMIGVNTDEGSQRTLTLFSKQKYITYFTNHYREVLPEYFGYDTFYDPDYITNLVTEIYFLSKPLNESFYAISEVYGLFNVHLGAIETALRYNGKLYFYCYDHLNRWSYVRNYVHMFDKWTKYKTGVIHGEELMSLFYFPLLFPPFLEGNDRIVSEQVVTMWYNFVAYGNPNGLNKTEVWMPVSSDNLEYLHIKNTSLVMKDRLLRDEYEFWKAIGQPTLMSRVNSKQSLCRRKN